MNPEKARTHAKKALNGLEHSKRQAENGDDENADLYREGAIAQLKIAVDALEP